MRERVQAVFKIFKTGGLVLATVFSVAVSAECSAHQIDDAGRMVSLIKKTAEYSGPNSADFEKLVQITENINNYTVEEAREFFAEADEISTYTGDEKVLRCTSLIEGVYYLNRNIFDKALECFLRAEKYSHDTKSRNYAGYLKAVCYLRENNIPMIESSVEDILRGRDLTNNSFTAVVYCESLRVMSFFYDYAGKKDMVGELLDEYCNISDTLICSAESVDRLYFPVPNFLQDKYFKRRPVDMYIKKNEKKSNTAAIALSVAAAFFLTGFGFYFTKYSRIKKIYKKNGSTNSAYQALSPAAGVLGQSGNAVAVVGTDGKINWVNKSFEKLYGCTKDEFILSYGDNVFFADRLKERGMAVTRCRGKLSAQEYTSFVNDIWIKGSVSPVLENGVLKEFLLTETDVTEIKKENLAERTVKTQIEGNLRNASDIQQILMPKKAEISKYFDNFIIYRPKDYVSGDFYWFGKIGKSFIFALGDCIGHGLSSSLLSVLSMKTLEDIILKDQISDPKEILTAMEASICKSLRQNTSGNRDGLDLTVCKITPGQGGAAITVSGAKSYFFYHSQGKTVMLRGSRKSVGGCFMQSENTEFADVTLTLQKGDCIYFSSDGIIDQNNPARKPLGRLRFSEMIDAAAKSAVAMDVQKEMIVGEFEKFCNGEIQRDDICVAGIKI